MTHIENILIVGITCSTFPILITFYSTLVCFCQQGWTSLRTLLSSRSSSRWSFQHISFFTHSIIKLYGTVTLPILIKETHNPLMNQSEETWFDFFLSFFIFVLISKQIIITCSTENQCKRKLKVYVNCIKWNDCSRWWWLHQMMMIV